MRHNNYVIQWKSKVNGRAGRGTKLFDREDAKKLAEDLNREYPQIVHEAITAPKDSETKAETIDEDTETVVTAE